MKTVISASRGPSGRIFSSPMLAFLWKEEQPTGPLMTGLPDWASLKILCGRRDLVLKHTIRNEI